ncbi:recombination regulator RecX [Streptococcus gallolyticus]|uniref:recombination regulator RecX n=1 Tax=Streptococcus hepaticus TaxID=3349163 RepID=UPI001C95BE25|nr:recombination regulator RecX [Streptococcus gallolyticus]MBY5042050.1 recombination regulator RecX [Streptococcus gallolyticus]
MKITKIEKKKRLYLLELESSDKCYITEDTIVRFMLSKDKDISPEELKEIQEFAQFSYGKNLALYHISLKQRTRKEVQDYLVKHEININYIPQILDNLEVNKWIDDKEYARKMIQSNQYTGDKGPFVLAQKLAQKGIGKKEIAIALAEADFPEIAQRVAEKIHRKYKEKLPSQALKTKILQQITAKGFSSTDTKIALSNLDIEKDQETETNLIYKELDKQFPKYARKYEGYELTQRLTQALARKGFSFDDIKSALRDYL